MNHMIEFSTDKAVVTIEIDDSFEDGIFCISLDKDSDYGKYAYIDIDILRKIQMLMSMKEQQK